MFLLKRPPERLSVSLLFGSAVHASLERFYRTIRDRSEKEPLGVLQELFQDRINHEVDQAKAPVIFKKETPDRASAVELGNSMLKAFHDSVNLDGFEVLEVECPLSARLYTDEGRPTELKLVGVLDLVLKDEQGRIIAVDSKTASKPYAQDTVDQDLHPSTHRFLAQQAADSWRPNGNEASQALSPALCARAQSEKVCSADRDEYG